MAKVFTESEGYSVSDLLHVGYDHVDPALVLLESNPKFFDSAGYLLQLGVEIVFKARHLHEFGEFDNTHKLKLLAEKVKFYSSDSDQLIDRLDGFYELRYPRILDGPIEIGSDMLPEIKEWLKLFWSALPVELIEIYESLDPTQKAGRVVLRKER